ncbi:helix-turn-helix domain-containing protein [Acetobacterium carbinolicum]|uniref:helix-turn-helix domain-containing protein n=1 Tax=Acetobacterium carbinolicum TaxID=52690 RepID=UPI0039C9E128
MAGIEQIKMSKSTSVIKSDDGKDIFQAYIMENETGEGAVSSCEMMDGVYVMYGDFNMESIGSEMEHSAKLFCLDYCYEGKLEWHLSDGLYFYQQAHDLYMDDRRHTNGSCFFPLRHYHSITVLFFLPNAQASLERHFDGFPVQISQLKKGFTDISYPYLIRNNPDLNRIFSDIKNAGEKNKQTYIKMKIIELLLYLDSISDLKIEAKNEYFYKSHVSKIKQIHELLTNDLEHHYTIEKLSQRFEMPISSMTSCFKGVYGNTVYAYTRGYRMEYAAKMLLQTDMSVVNIALAVGYANPSKFSAAFKQEIGLTPNEYKKRKAVPHIGVYHAE